MNPEQFDPLAPRPAMNLGLRPDPEGRTHPHRPMPDHQGTLVIDPDILLRAQKFNLEINYFYSSAQNQLTFMGMNRNASVDCYVDTTTVTGQNRTVYGDFSSGNYSSTAPSFAPLNGTVSTLGYDGVADQFTEYFPNGMQLVYGTTVLYNHIGTDITDAYRVIRSVDASGVIQTYNYILAPEFHPPYRLLQSIQVPGGNLVTMSYSSQVIGVTTQWQRSNIQDWGNRTWTFQYDSGGNLTTYTTPAGCTTKYTYTSPAVGTTLIYTIEDPRGFRTTYGYDIKQRVISMAAGAAIWGWTFIDSQSTQVMTEPNGALTTYILDSSGQPSTTIWSPGFMSTYMYGNKLKMWEFKPQGQICSIAYNQTFWGNYSSADPLGNFTTYLYDSYGNLTTHMDALSNLTSFTFATPASKLMTARTDPLGNVTSYQYSSAGQVQSTQDPRGLLTTYSYDTWGNLASMVTSDGGVTTNTYDILNRLIATQDPLGRTSSYGYDLADNRVSATNPLGQTTTYIYNTCLLQAIVDPLGNRTSYTYDRFQNRLSTMDPLGNISTNIYDAAGNPIGSMDPLGNITTTILDKFNRPSATMDPLGFLTTYSYDNAGRQYMVTDPRGFITTTVYNARDAIARIDALGNRWTTVYDGLGRSIGSMRPLGDSSTTVYDKAGRVVASVDALGNRTTNSYDQAGNLIGVLDPLGRRTTNVYAPNSNRRIATIDALGGRTTYNFDLAGQLVTMVSVGGFISTNLYDGAGRQQSSIDVLGNRTTRVYDIAGRSVAFQDALGYYSTTQYDAASRTIANISPLGFQSTTQYDPAGRATTLIDPLGNTRVSHYDANGRIVTSQDERGFVTTYSYDAQGNTVRTSNPRGYWTSQTYDALGRRLAQIDWYGNQTTYGYDSNGRQVQIRDARGYSTTTTYSVRDEVTALTDGLGRITSYGYDSASNQTSRQLGGGAITSYGYDSLNRKVTALYTSGKRLTFGYDASSNRTTMVDWLGTATYTYDALNRMSGKSQYGLSQSYSYGARGERTGMVVPDGTVRTYQYDINLRLTTYQASDGTQVTYQYDADSKPVVVAQKDTNVRNLTYDAAGNVVSVITNAPSGTLIERFTYAYDPGGLKTLALDSFVAITYGYDAKDRLITEFAAGASMSWTHTFAYDGADNMTTLDGVNYTLNAANQRVSGSDGSSWQWDANSNLVTWVNSTLYSYDEENRSISESHWNGSIYGIQASYLYDGDGKKALEIGQTGAVTTLVWDGEDYLGAQS